jgi:hypothetical protein
VVHDDYDAPLWRAMALAGQGKWAAARDGFKTIESASATIPVELAGPRLGTRRAPPLRLAISRMQQTSSMSSRC